VLAFQTMMTAAMVMMILMMVMVMRVHMRIAAVRLLQPQHALQEPAWPLEQCWMKCSSHAHYVD
jgi:hypothetical protein